MIYSEYDSFRRREKSRRNLREDFSKSSLCVVYRDDIGVVQDFVDEAYGISFDGTKAYFDAVKQDGDSRSIRVPVKNIIYIGDPKNYG